MGRKKVSPTPITSTAARFRDLEGTVPEPPVPGNDGIDNGKANDHDDGEPDDEIPPEDMMDDPSMYSFPFNYIYSTQDFLNDHLTYSKTIQIIGMAYMCQLFYNEVNQPWEFWEKIAMNYTGVLIGLIVTYKLSWNKFKLGELKDAPKLPEFNLIYPLILINILCLKNDFKLIENLSYNYLVIENLPLAVRGFSSISFFMLYGESSELNNFIKKIVLFIILNYLIDYINLGNEQHSISKEVIEQDINIPLDDLNQTDLNDEEINEKQNDETVITSGLTNSLSKSEIQLILVCLINLMFNLDTEDISLIIFQKLIIGLITSLVLSWPIFKFNKSLSLIIATGIFIGLTEYQLNPILHMNSLAWISNEINQNFTLFSSWVILLIVNIAIIFNINLEFNLRRKIWHFIILVTIVPSLFINYDFTKLSLLGSIVILTIVEIIRSNKITIIGEILYDKLYRFQDFKDLKGPLNLSYIYLLIGISIPIFLDNFRSDNLNLQKFIGLICLGIGDSMASIIGKKFGRHYFKGSNKTVEGSLSFFVSSLISFQGLSHYLNVQVHHELLFIVNLVGSIFEGTLNMNDNLILSLIIYIMWDILEMHF